MVWVSKGEGEGRGCWGRCRWAGLFLCGRVGVASEARREGEEVGAICDFPVGEQPRCRIVVCMTCQSPEARAKDRASGITGTGRGEYRRREGDGICRVA